MHSSVGRLLLNALLPLALLVPIVFAVRRHRTAQMMLGIALGAILLALYTGPGRGCSYCVQRNLLPIAPLGAVAIGAGLVVAAGSQRRFALASALALSVATLAATYDQGVIERQRLANGSYLLEPQDRQAIAAVPRRPGYVELEGFGQGPLAPMEEPLVYNLVDERTDGGSRCPPTSTMGGGSCIWEACSRSARRFTQITTSCSHAWRGSGPTAGSWPTPDRSRSSAARPISTSR